MKTFIFGAGASAPFFKPKLDTRRLTQRVCSKKEWNRIIEKYKEERGEDAHVPKLNKIIEVIKHIREFNSEANFETIAEVLDKICSCGANVNQRLLGKNSKVLSIIFSVLNGGHDERAYKFWIGWSSVPFLFREIIAETILEFQKSHKVTNYDTLSELQHKFLKYVCVWDSEVSVVSLNYDDCIIDSLKNLEFELGFSKNTNRYENQIDEAMFMYAPKVAYFPHGHIKFQFTDNRNVTFREDSNEADKMRWNSSKSTLGFPGKFADGYNTFISTGLTKEDGFNNMPYSLYYQRLAVDLFKSSEVYIIGYSFGDEHINRLLHSFLHLNPNNKIFIIDYIDGGAQISGEETTGIIYKIKDAFKTGIQFNCDLESGLKHEIPENIREINNQGYGELFPQIVFYKNGYNKFLRQFKDVLEYYYKRKTYPSQTV